MEYADLPSPGRNENCAPVCPRPDYWTGKFLFGLNLKGQVHLCWTYHTATHVQPTKLMRLGNNFILPHSVVKYIWLYSTYTTVSGANTLLTMGEILVKRDFSGIADAVSRLRIDVSPR